jgi:Diphthamide synthase
MKGAAESTYTQPRVHRESKSDTEDLIAEELAMMRRDNYGFRRVERLAGKVGYLLVDNGDDCERPMVTDTSPAAKTLLSWSGGKDSALVLHVLRQTPGVEVCGLLTTVTEEYDRISMHGIRWTLLERQAEEAGLPRSSPARQIRSLGRFRRIAD